ncbi:MAG: hypothetical protein Sv326_0870 [Candidatus Fermentimicrarchaeum limneticum]|uniref:Homing endonuclease LAGLIDADG domain-containing protein n=1 Tax=Fermentimicrarchaeum limneticum TaxID=2795018 RepID=A0A7D5XCH8_FERL1|nr:MAG: hypothetical protein Sv326_0870 [Candidatus Fermentimicrarchaeum limneticum]
MRIKMTPELAYLIGLWKGRRVPSGIGIRGSGEIREIFLKEIMKTLKIPPEKIQMTDRDVYFYHSAYRTFFEGAEKNQIDVFRKRNRYSSSYVAGMFDSCGGVEGDTPYLARASYKDQMLLELLGFRTRFIKGRLAIMTPREFIVFVKDSMKHSEVKKALMRSGNERDRR